MGLMTLSLVAGALSIGTAWSSWYWNRYHQKRNKRIANALRLWMCSSRTIMAEDVGMLSAVVFDLENH